MTIYHGRQVNGVTSTYTLSKIGGEHKNCKAVWAPSVRPIFFSV